MEDTAWLSQEDKKQLESLKKELATLKLEHKSFAKRKNSLTVEDREKWKVNAQRTDQVYVAIKELRFKNVMEAGKG
jgi:uncharacterized membrane protein YgaE (UPF0421/DUF939 family)